MSEQTALAKAETMRRWLRETGDVEIEGESVCGVLDGLLAARSSSEPSVTTDAETIAMLERLADNRAHLIAAAVHETEFVVRVRDEESRLRTLARSLRSARTPPAVDAGTTDADDRPRKMSEEEIAEHLARYGCTREELAAIHRLEWVCGDGQGDNDMAMAIIWGALTDARAALRAARSPAVDDETPKLLAQVAKAAAAFCAELQEDGEGVPQPELRALHAALDAVDLAKLEADWLTHLAVCYRCNEDHRDPCDIGARIRAEMDALDERIDSAAARRSPDSAPEANNA